MPIFPSGVTSLFIPDYTINANTRILVDFSGDPGAQVGAGVVKWIELLPGVGFIIHLTTVCQEDTEFLFTKLPLTSRVSVVHVPALTTVRPSTLSS